MMNRITHRNTTIMYYADKRQVIDALNRCVSQDQAIKILHELETRNAPMDWKYEAMQRINQLSL